MDQTTTLPAPAVEDPAPELERLVRAIAALEHVVGAWGESRQLTVQALTSAIADLNKAAFRRLIRNLRIDPTARHLLAEAATDPLVYGVLRFHGLAKDSLQSRLEKALDEVRPFMATHGGDVELVAVKPPDTVEVRLVGACQGCPASSPTLSEGVEKSIRSHCPEIVHIHQVSKGPSESGTSRGAVASHGESTVHFTSPFALHASSGWIDAADLADIPEGGIFERRIKDRSVLLSQQRGNVSCLDNLRPSGHAAGDGRSAGRRDYLLVPWFPVPAGDRRVPDGARGATARARGARDRLARAGQAGGLRA